MAKPLEAPNPKLQAPRERPIIFSGEMVRAILEGRKTQTRRIVADKRLSPKLTLLELFDFLGGGDRCDTSDDDGLRVSFVKDYDRQDDDGRRYKYTGLLVQSEAVPEDGAEEIVCPHGVPGDRLWVRETHWRHGYWSHPADDRRKFVPTAAQPVYYLDRPGYEGYESPKDRTERAWYKRPSIFMPRWASRITLEITKVRVERLQDISEPDALAEYPPVIKGIPARADFKTLWDSLHSKGAWDKNPWVWVLEFRPLNLSTSQPFSSSHSARGDEGALRA